MHEFSLVQGVMNGILEAAEQNGLTSVSAVKLRIGGLRQVVPETMEFAFNSAASGTIADNSRLEMEFIPVIAVCEICRAESEIEGNIFLCPECGSTRMETRQGMELIIDSIEGE